MVRKWSQNYDNKEPLRTEHDRKFENNEPYKLHMTQKILFLWQQQTLKSSLNEPWQQQTFNVGHCQKTL